MAWHAAGTADFTNGSTSVAGTGTGWIGAVEIGDALHGPDGNVYEITGVVSDGDLTISPAYLGVTVSGASYRIQPTRGWTAEVLGQVAALIANYQAGVDGAMAGKFPAGSLEAPSVRGTTDQDTGLRFPGDNTIEAVTAGVRRWLLGNTAFQVDVPMTGAAVQSDALDATPGRLMPVGAFGLGAAVQTEDVAADRVPGFRYGFTGVPGAPVSGASNWSILDFGGFNAANCVKIAVRQNYVTMPMYVSRVSGNTLGPWSQIYHQKTILGTVSQSSGEPTGALFERNANANGEYLRLPDGTQICTRLHPIAYSNASVMAADWTYPASFAGAPAIFGSINVSSFNAGVTGPTLQEVTSLQMGSVSTTSASVQLMSISGMTAFDPADACSVQVFAIGRWF